MALGVLIEVIGKKDRVCLVPRAINYIVKKVHGQKLQATCSHCRSSHMQPLALYIMASKAYRASASRARCPPLNCAPRSPITVSKPSSHCSINAKQLAVRHASLQMNGENKKKCQGAGRKDSEQGHGRSALIEGRNVSGFRVRDNDSPGEV
jgi:hypothetical protein